MKEPRVFIETEWVEQIVLPLINESKEDFAFFFLCCIGYALRWENHKDKMTGFVKPHLQSLWEQTSIHRWDLRSGKAAYIGLKRHKKDGKE